VYTASEARRAASPPGAGRGGAPARAAAGHRISNCIVHVCKVVQKFRITGRAAVHIQNSILILVSSVPAAGPPISNMGRMRDAARFAAGVAAEAELDLEELDRQVGEGGRAHHRCAATRHCCQEAEVLLRFHVGSS
jgi:hypothetical protein